MRLTLETLHMYVEEVGDCWIWKASCNSAGYPQANVDGKGDLVARHVWKMMGKTVPSRRYCLVTTCGDRECVNPAHIAMRTRSSVLRQAYEAGKRMGLLEYRGRLQGAQHLAKLNAAQVEQIRSRPKHETHAAIAKEFGVSSSCVGRIRRGTSWKTFGASVFSWRPANDEREAA